MTSPNPIAATIILVLSLQAILLGILLLFKKSKEQSSIFLTLLLFFFALLAANIALINLLVTYEKLSLFRYIQLELLYGIGPSLYLFTKSTTDPKYQISKMEYLHFVPVVLEFIFYRTSIYRIGSEGLDQIPMHPFTQIYLLEQWVATLSIIAYIFLSIRILVNCQHWIKNKHSNLKRVSLSWLKIPVLAYSGFWIGWLLLTHLDKFFFDNAFKPYYFMPTFIGLSFVTCWIGFKGYVSSQTKALGFSKASKEHLIRQNSNPKETQALLSLMESKKLYLNPELDLAKLSEHAKLNPKFLSQLINNDLGMNFYEFVNSYRVNEFKDRILQKNSSKLTLLGHALESGFNSKSTFNYIFKKFTGQTPSQYYLQGTTSPNRSSRTN